MAVLHLNRCKNCRLWREIDRRLPGQFRAGTPSRVDKTCRLQLRETEKNGETVLVATLDVAQDTRPGPFFGQATKPGHTCKYFVQKHMPRRKAPPVTITLEEVAAVDPADPRPVVCDDRVPFEKVEA